MVEVQYKVSRDRASRAVAGLSMGAAESLLLGLSFNNKFAYVGGFSVGGMSSDYAADFPTIAKGTKLPPTNVWLSCGTEDKNFGLQPVPQVMAQVKKGTEIEDRETNEMHDWLVWCKNFVAFSQELFKRANH